ncbi:MAG: hypothetical protein ACYTHM_02190 [Planctomycetota bacterium]|jgi:cytochrome c5
MKWQIGISVTAVVAVLLAANLVKRDRAEKDAQAAFEKAVRKGDEVYGRACGACHDRYDPRFFLYEEWARILEDSGCPLTRIDLSLEDRQAILDYLRAKAAPTQTESETLQSRERARVHSESVREGAAVYQKACLACHEHPYFLKIRTARGWTEVMADLGGYHRTVKEPVYVVEAEGRVLQAYLSANAAGTPADARAIQALLDAGSAPSEAVAPPTEGHGIHWVRDHEKGLKEAAERKMPVIVDVTDLSGG